MVFERMSVEYSYCENNSLTTVYSEETGVGDRPSKLCGRNEAKLCYEFHKYNFKIDKKNFKKRSYRIKS
jgi:hypothetical protein